MTLRLVAGLGNPGYEYRDSYHNIGYRAIDSLRRTYDGNETDRRPGTLYETTDTPVTYLAKPDCYVNQSGGIIKQWVDDLDLSPEDLLVIYDDFSLDVGEIRLRPEGSAGGHNGMKSITAALETENIPRLRLGIGPLPEGVDPADFVLSPMSDDDRDHFESIFEVLPEILVTVVEDGINRAMSEYNGDRS